MHIEAGKYYFTEEGDRVGPMALWTNELDTEHPWEQLGGTNRFSEGGDIWRADGTSDYVTALVRLAADNPLDDLPAVSERYPRGPLLKHPQDMSLNELFDHVAIVNDAIRAALANHPGFVPVRRD